MVTNVLSYLPSNLSTPSTSSDKVKSPPSSSGSSPLPIVVLNHNLIAASTESLSDLINGLSTNVVELDGVVAHGNGVALVELASNNGGESHTSRGQTSNKEVCWK